MVGPSIDEKWNTNHQEDTPIVKLKPKKQMNQVSGVRPQKNRQLVGPSIDEKWNTNHQEDTHIVKLKPKEWINRVN